MRYRYGFFSLSLVSVFISAILWITSTSAAPSAAAKDNWMAVKTPNFSLIGNAGERDIRRVATELEQFRAAFARLFTQARLQSPAPTRVIVFKSDGAFRPFKPLYEGKPAAISGYFQAGTDVNYIALTSETRSENPYAVIFHEYVHALTKNNSRRAPIWFSEGLAEYYSTFEVADDGKRILLGKPVANHVYLLRDRPLLPLATLFAVDHRSPHYNERDKKGVLYAESWALIHYFMQSDNGARRQSFINYLNLLASGKPIEESFRQAFKTDFATLEKNLRDYISRQQYTFDAVTLGERLSVEAGMETAQLTEADAQYYLGDLLLHTERLDDAERYLQQAISLDSKLAGANASLGLLRMRQKRYAEARQHLATASASGATNPLAHYYYAWTISHEQMSDNNTVSAFSPEALQLMRAELRKSIELAPEFAEAQRLLAFIELVAGEDLKSAETLIRRAQILAPGEGEYGYLLAQILMGQGRFTLARETLAPIAAGDSDPGLRSRAETMLANVDRSETEMARRAKHATDADAANVKETVPQASTSATSSAGNSPVDPPPAMPRLRRLAEGEKQVEGLLVDIDCTGTQMTLSIKVEETVLILRASSAESVQFVSFTPGVSGKLTCGPQKTPSQVRVIYRPLPPASGKVKIVGEPVRVEFLM
jgi:tetratricopeptide (TPR) repeat protein